MGIFDKLKQGLQRTTQQLKERFEEIVSFADAPEARMREIDVDTADALEEILLMADVGVAASGEIVAAVKRRQRRGESLRDLVKEEMLRILAGAGAPIAMSSRPHVMLIVGVNGVGKTTTIGKLAAGWKAEGRTTLLCAADTFRAAAAEQLAIWAERSSSPFHRGAEGAAGGLGRQPLPTAHSRPEVRRSKHVDFIDRLSGAGKICL